MRREITRSILWSIITASFTCDNRPTDHNFAAECHELVLFSTLYPTGFPLPFFELPGHFEINYETGRGE